MIERPKTPIDIGSTYLTVVHTLGSWKNVRNLEGVEDLEDLPLCGQDIEGESMTSLLNSAELPF